MRLLTIVLLALPGTLTASEVPVGDPDYMPTTEHPVGYRGDGSGIYPTATPPLMFDEQTKTNLKWVTQMPGWSHSPPIVVGRKVFVAAEPDTTICVDADSGKILWQDSLGLLQPIGPGWGMHSGNGYTTASSDGKAIYRAFVGRHKDAKKRGSLVVSYDLDGKRRWLTETVPLNGTSSPLLIGNRVMVAQDGGSNNKHVNGTMFALDAVTGKVAWGPLRHPPEPGEPVDHPWGADDGSPVAIRLGSRDIAVTPLGWLIDPQTGKLLGKTMPVRSVNGRVWHPLGIKLTCHSPIPRPNPDGSVTVVFCADDSDGLLRTQGRDAPLAAVPPDADMTQDPWSKPKDVAVRVLPCRLSLDAAGQIRSEQLWPQPSTVRRQGGDGSGPHIALCGERIAVLNVKGHIGVMDRKTGRTLGKDFQPIYENDYRKVLKGIPLDTPELNAARAAFGMNMTMEQAFGPEGTGQKHTNSSMNRMGKALYARSAVDSRNYLWVAHRWGEIYVLELTDNGFREVSHNKVNLPLCWCVHAAPVFQGDRLYYRTFGHLYCFEAGSRGINDNR